MNYENLLKRFLKKKIKFTQSLLVLFFITGGIVQAADYTITAPVEITAENPATNFLATYIDTDGKEVGISIADGTNIFKDTQSLIENAIIDTAFTTGVDSAITGIVENTTATEADPANGIIEVIVGKNEDGTDITKFYTVTGGSRNTVGTQNLTGDINESYVGGTSSNAGGVFNNASKLDYNITGDFIGNYSEAYGGAIQNAGILANITGNFIANSSNGNGGAIQNSTTIGSITGDFIGNSAGGFGGAIINFKEITSISGNFMTNSTPNNGGAIQFSENGTAETITGDFIGNSAGGFGGAIINFGYMGSLIGDFVKNTAGREGGGAILNATEGFIGTLAGDFLENTAGKRGGAIENGGTIESLSGNFFNNSSTETGGAIHNSGGDITITGNSNFTGNTANGESNAIQNSNKTDEDGNIVSNGSITLAPSTDEEIVFNDKIVGEAESNLIIGTGTNDGKVDLNADMDGVLGNTTILGGTIEVGPNMDKGENGDTNFFGGDVNIEGDFNLDLTNGVDNQVNVGNWETVTKPDGTEPTISASVDIDMANGTNDKFTNVDGQDIVIDNIVVVNPVPGQDVDVTIATPAPGATNGGIGNVTVGTTTATGTDGVFDYEYVVDPDRFVNGQLQMDGVGADQVATAALDATVAAAAYGSNIMNITDRILNKTREHDFSNSVWVDISSSEETLDSSTAVKNETFDNKVNILTAGLDFQSNIFNNVENVSSIYFGQLSSTQNFRDQELAQEGFFLGYGFEATNDQKFVNFTINAAKLDAENNDGRGEKFGIDSISVATKVGMDMNYGSMTITPSLVLGYHNIKTDSYTNVNGMSVSSSTTNILNLKPEIKITGDIAGFNPYATLAYSHNIYEGGEVKVSNIELAGGEVESYGELRIGVDTTFMNDTLGAYAEFITTAGDKDSYGAQVGFEYRF